MLLMRKEQQWDWSMTLLNLQVRDNQEPRPVVDANVAGANTGSVSTLSFRPILRVIEGLYHINRSKVSTTLNVDSSLSLFTSNLPRLHLSPSTTLINSKHRLF